MSLAVKSMTTTYDCSVTMTVELPKESLRQGVRPRLKNIKGTSGIPYDSNLNLGVYNDLKDFPDTSTVFWEDKKDFRKITDGAGRELQVYPKKPVVELVIDKSKITEFDGVIYYAFDPVTGEYRECLAEGSGEKGEGSQEQYKALASGKPEATAEAMAR
jgi:hypothetical protein